jgi:uncharacterized phage protein (TIGR02218 family)
MRALTLDLAAATITRLITITRRDDTVIRLTTWPSAIRVGDEGPWLPAPGIKTFDISERNNGEAAATQLQVSAIDGGLITAADIEDGLFEGARVEIFLVDADNPTAKDFEFLGRIGSWSFPAHDVCTFVLKNPLGFAHSNLVPTFSVMCRFGFGDAFCGVALDERACAIATVVNQHNMTLTALPDPRAGDDAWYAPGKIKFVSGTLKGRTFRIGGWRASDRQLTTYLPAGLLAQVGDTAQIWKDCNKTLAQCIDPFNNGRRFGGFPYYEGAKAVALDTGQG